MVPRYVALVVLILLVAWPSGGDGKPRRPRNPLNNTDVSQVLTGVAEQSGSVSSLEDALSVLENLTLSQKQLWEQQQVREEELRQKAQEDLEREKQRTEALLEEHKILQEMKGKVSRKLKAMAKPAPTYAAGNLQGGPASTIPPRDCADLYLDAEETSGVYRVWPTWGEDNKGFLVYCDMETDGGGWTVIRRWGTDKFSSSFFQKMWTEYKNGFGDMHNDFWLGNEKIHALTNQASYQLRFDISTIFNNRSSFYGRFWLASEGDKYLVHAENYLDKSTAGNLMSTHNDAMFSASDRNHIEVKEKTDQYGYRNSRPNSPPKCGFGWWYKNDCDVDRLLDPTNNDGRKEMKIRPDGFGKLRESS